MNNQTIPLFNIFLSFIPVVLLLVVFFSWKLPVKKLALASGRMLIQLLLIGYFLKFIFQQNSNSWTIGILCFMILVSAWISLESIADARKKKYPYALVALTCGALPVLLLTTAVTIPNQSWSDPAFIIPLAGMVFSNGMNTIGVAAERYQMEVSIHPEDEALSKALFAALIPLLNSFFAVGLVSLPGMMTGQILSGIDPLIAVRYQIVVMTMVMGSGGLSAALYLKLSSRKALKEMV